MKYNEPKSGAIAPYPSHNIDPRVKQSDPKKFCMPYAKAAYNDWLSIVKGVFASNGGDYEKFRMYAMGKQPNSPYRKMLGVDAETENTWLSVDWSIRSIVSPYRDKAISRCMAMERDIIATPIDMLARDEENEYFSELKAKILVRQLMQQQNPEMANHPMIALQKTDPSDLEELEMRVELNEQFVRSKDAEQAIALGFYENGYNNFRRSLYEDLFDYGVAGYKEWLGADNKAKFRKVNPDCVITSFCRKSDFTDMVHAGEVIDVPLVELATLCDDEGNKVFTEDQLHEFAGSIAGKFGNPTSVGKGTGWFKPYDKFSCKVLDIEFYSYDDHVYRDTVDEMGNPDFRKADYGRGKQSDKYKRKRIQVIYKCKWIVGTDHCYDFGLANDMKRENDPKKKAQTSLSFKFIAYNFYEMRAQGFMERLIPYLDEYQLTMLKIQNFKNRAVPSGWWIDLDGLENTALSKGGAAMKPNELLQMFFDTGVLVGRSRNAQGDPLFQNSQPVIPIANTAAAELAMFYQELVNIIMAIERLTGYNDATMGDPNPKTLTAGYELANQSTSDALNPLVFAEKWLSEQLAQDVLLRMKQGVKKGGVSGYAPALGGNTLKFMEISPDIALRDYGIMTEARADSEQKAWLYQMMAQDIANGWLDTSDAVLIINTFNVKQAQMIWSYRVKKAKERQHMQEMQKIELNNQGAQQAAQVAVQSKQQELMMQIQADLQKEQMRIQGEVMKERERLASEERRLAMKIQADMAIGANSDAAKIQASEIQAEAKIESTIISSEGDLEKQKLANQKPQPKSTSKK
jgi:hypothetical protein